MNGNPYTIAADQLRALTDPMDPSTHRQRFPGRVKADARHHLILAELERRRRLCAVYDATPRHADLCDFDAHGMDVIEGRRA